MIIPAFLRKASSKWFFRSFRWQCGLSQCKSDMSKNSASDSQSMTWTFLEIRSALIVLGLKVK